MQGAADLVMGLSAALAGGLAGVVVGAWGYAVLAVAAAVSTWSSCSPLSAPRRSAGAPRDPADRGWQGVPHERWRSRGGGGGGRHRRIGLLLVPRRAGGARGGHAIRRPLGSGHGRVRRRAAGGLPAPARDRARVPAAPDQLPREPLGAAVPGRAPGAGACAVGGLRDESRPETSSCPTSSSTAPPAGSSRTSRPARCTCPSPTPTARGCPPVAAADPSVKAGEHGRDRGPAVLHPRRVPALRRQGWSLISMTGQPEAALARELRRATPGSRWSPTWTPAWRPAPVSRAGGVRAVRPQHRPAQGPADHGHRAAARPRRLHLLDLGRGHRPDLRGPGRTNRRPVTSSCGQPVDPSLPVARQAIPPTRRPRLRESNTCSG